MEQEKGITGNALKIIALITMTLDHVGLLLLHNYQPFRIVGRIAFPLFAYMIAEGCRYTKNKRNYFLRIFGLGLLCQLAYYITERSTYQGILMTFSVSILISYAVLWAQGNRQNKQGNKKDKVNVSSGNGALPEYVILSRQGIMSWCIVVVLIALAAVITGQLPILPARWQIQFDYGFFGILLPVLIAAGKNKWQKLILSAVGISLTALSFSGSFGKIQWASLAAVPIIALYNGRKGKWNMKYLFYIYYPLHMAVIYGLAMIIH